MNYNQAIDWLFSQVPNYQIQGNSAYKPGLQNIQFLAESLGNPHQSFKSIHVAGTNGKGSTTNMLASVLQETGYKVGLFTSPHLKEFTERIKINGQEVDQNFVLDFILKIKENVLEIQPSFFEITTLLAFEYFAQNLVDIACIETGLGGKLDATNIIIPEISVITSISYDHQDLLGNTLEKITLEKCGIIKENIPVINGDEKPVVQEIIQQIAKEKNAKYKDATLLLHDYQTDLLGNYQQQNIKTVLATLEELQHQGWQITEKNIEVGLQNVIKNTGLCGRWQILQQNPLIIADVGHNEAGFQYIIEQLSEFSVPKIHMVLGFVKGKDVERLFKLLPKNDQYYFVKPAISRALDPLEYENLIQQNALSYQMFHTVEEGFLAAKGQAHIEDVIFIGGSNFVVAEVL